MISILARPAVRFLVTAGMACAFLAIPVSWPGFAIWPAGTTTLSPADSSGQTFVLEFDHPLRVEFPATFGAAQDVTRGHLSAQVTVLYPSRSTIDRLPVRIDAARSRVQVPLAAVGAAAGARLRVILRDPAGQTWLGATEHNSYPSGTRLVGERPVGGDLAFRVEYRRTLLEILLSGLSVALGSWRLIVAAGISIGAAGLLVGGALRRFEGLDLAARLSASIGGGLLLTTVVGWTAAVLHLRVSAGAVLLAALAMASLGLFLWLRPGASQGRLDLGALGLIACLVVFGFLRLAFASPLSLPPHIDAVEHYAIVADLLAPDRPPIAENDVSLLATQYYHFGFHGLAAWVLSLAGGATPFTLIALGQLLQGAAIVGIYFPTYAAVRDSRAALAAVVLAGVGWTMPAHASDWSRYPALLSLAVLPAAVGLALLAWRAAGNKRILLLAAAGLAAVGVTLAHTRMLFLLAGFIFSVEGARRLVALSAPRGFTVRKALPIAMAISIALTIAWLASPLQRDAAWVSLTESFNARGILSTVLVLGLAPFALRRYPTAALGTLLWAASILLLVFLPPQASYPFPILDAPLVRMALFLPLSALGGLGVAGLMTALRSSMSHSWPARGLRMALAAAGILYMAWAFSWQSNAPGECCLIAGPDDAAIAQEAPQLLTSAARILIPSQAQVNYSPAPVDGGAWLLPLSGLRTVLWPANAELASPAEHQGVCAAGITHIYVGGTSLSYPREELDFAPAFYTPTLVHPHAALYAVVGCGP